MGSTLDQTLAVAIQSFVDDVLKLTREAALASVAGVFGAAKSAPTGKAAPATRSSPRASGAKRSPKELAATVARLEGHVQKSPGERIEQISKALGLSTRDLALPARKLLAAGRVRTEGQKRATRYFAA